MHKRNLLNITLVTTIIVVGYTPLAKATSDQKTCWGHVWSDCSSDYKRLNPDYLSSESECMDLAKAMRYPYMKWGIFGKCQSTKN